eukprot:393598_1
MALLYITLPARIVVASSKVFFIMLARVFLMKKSYLYIEYLNVLVLISGSALVLVADKRPQTNPDYKPNALLGGLCMLGSIVSNVVEVIFCEKVMFKKRRCSSAEILFFSSIASSSFAIAYAFIKDEVTPALTHAHIYP